MLAAAFLDASDPWIRWDWFWRHVPEFQLRLVEHIQLTMIAVVVGFLIAAPLGVVASRWRPLRGPLLAVGGVFYTVPSLPFFSFFLPFTCLSLSPAALPLFLYPFLLPPLNTVLVLYGLSATQSDAAIRTKKGHAQQGLAPAPMP